MNQTKLIAVCRRGGYNETPKRLFGKLLINLIAMAFGILVDWEPLAKPSEYLTGIVRCPHCKQDSLRTVSGFNETEIQCLNFNCCKSFTIMNDGIKMWAGIFDN